MVEKMLTKAQIEMLRIASREPRGKVSTYGVQQRTLDALREMGMIETIMDHTDAQIQEHKKQIDQFVKEAKEIFEKDWYEAYGLLSRASHYKRLAERTTPAITPKAQEYLKSKNLI